MPRFWQTKRMECNLYIDLDKDFDLLPLLWESKISLLHVELWAAYFFLFSLLSIFTIYRVFGRSQYKLWNTNTSLWMRLLEFSISTLYSVLVTR